MQFSLRTMLGVILLVGMFGAGSAGAEEKKNPSPGDGASSQKQAGQQSAPGKGSTLTVYVPPPRGSVGARTGGGTRGTAAAPRIAVLAPDHIGVTTRAQPALAWYLSAPTDAPVELTVIADDAVDPLVVKRLPGPMKAGIHLEDLAQQGVQLEEGTTYDWYIALVVDPKARDADVVAGGAIQRRAATPELTSELKGGDPSYRVLARNGVWYDAIADLSKAVDAASRDTAESRALRAERAALLEQVGVGAAALYEREGGG
jgi:Domain of Unknown Function (DUF928)